MLTKAHAAGVRASFFTGDEVYGSRALRTTCRTLDLGYAVAVRTDHQVTTRVGKLTCKKATKKIPGGSMAVRLGCAHAGGLATSACRLTRMPAPDPEIVGQPTSAAGHPPRYRWRGW